MQVVGQLSIEIMAGIARLQSDMDKAKRTVGDAVNKMKQVLGTIGVGISVAGFASLIKSTVDIGDKFNDLRKITGLTVEQLAGLEKAALLNGSSLDQVAKAIGIMSKNIVAGSDALQSLGISSKQANGEFRSTNDVLLDVADRLSRMQDGVQKATLAQEIFGKSGRELIPLLNEGRAALQSQIEAYGASSGMTTRLAEESDRFNDILTLLGSRVTAVKNSFVAELLPTLNNIGTAMLTTGQSTNQFSFAASVVVPVLKGLAIAGFTVVDTFRGMGREIGARAAQLAAFASMDFKGAKFIGAVLAEDNAKARAEYDKFVDTIMNGDKSVQQFTETQKEYLKIEQQLPDAVDETTKALKKKKVLTDAEQLSALRQQESTKRTIDLYQDAKRLTDSVATSQDKYNSELTELNRLRPYVSVGTYDRALDKLNETTVKTAAVTKTATDEVSQLWMQAGRNIQSTLANSIFNFFDDGLKGMLKNVISTIGRIAAEFAALKIAQSIGLASMFSMPGTASASSGTGGGSLLNITSMGYNAMSMFKGGFGIPGLVGRGVSMLPGSLGAFGSGMSGTGAAAARGATALWGTSGLTGINAAGSSFAAAAGPAMGIAMALFAVDAIGRMLAGDKKLGGAEMIPVVGGFLAAMFGHGPMKFRQQVAIGEASSEGFDGRVTDVFRAKGGLVVGNKHREQSAENEAVLLDLFHTTIKGYADASRGFAKNLGLDVATIDGYHKTIRLESEKKKTLTEEAIREMLSGIGNEMADSLIPAISTLKKTGEDSMATLSRLNSEFLGLTQGAENLGASIGYAKDLIMGMSFESRTAFVDAAGGLEALAAKTQFFSQNFLTDAERLAPVQERLNAALVEMGLSTSLTRDEFKNLVQTNDELRLGLLNLAPEFVAVTNAMQASADAADALAKTTAAEALAKAQTRTNTQRTLEIQLLDAQGKTQEALTARRIDELMAMDSSLITLKQAIFRQEDFNAKRLAGIETAKGNLAAIFDGVDTAFSALTRSVEADKNKILTENAAIEEKRELATINYNAALDAQNVTINQFADSIRELQGFSDSLKSTIDTISPLSLEAARSQIQSAIQTGNLNTAAVSSALGILSKTEVSGFTSALEFKRAQAKNVQLLNDLNMSTDAQLTLEQRTMSALEAARDRLTDSYETEIKILDDQLRSNAGELSRLDQIIIDARTQIDVLRGIDVSVMSLASALSAFSASTVAVAGGQSALTAAQAVAEVFPQQVSVPIPMTIPAPLNVAQAINAPFQGPLPAKSLPLNISAARTAPFQGPTNASIAKQLSNLQTTMEVMTVSTNKTKRVLEKWEGVGMPATRTA